MVKNQGQEYKKKKHKVRGFATIVAWVEIGERRTKFSASQSGDKSGDEGCPASLSPHGCPVCVLSTVTVTYRVR